VAEVWFYHLQGIGAAEALRALLPRCLAAGWRVSVRGTDPARLEALDRALWLGEGFLPHGLAGGPHDARQPILLTEGPPANDPACVMSVDGAELGPLDGLARACVVFDGEDAAALDRARAQWSDLTGAGAAARYWQRDDGRWAEKATRNVAPAATS
jgi:DNA polymerase-3 subunit chi